MIKDIFWDKTKSEVSMKYWGYPWLVSSSLFMNWEEFLWGHLPSTWSVIIRAIWSPTDDDRARIASDNHHCWSHRPRIFIIKSHLILWSIIICETIKTPIGTQGHVTSATYEIYVCLSLHGIYDMQFNTKWPGLVQCPHRSCATFTLAFICILVYLELLHLYMCNAKLPFGKIVEKLAGHQIYARLFIKADPEAYKYKHFIHDLGTVYLSIPVRLLDPSI